MRRRYPGHLSGVPKTTPAGRGFDIQTGIVRYLRNLLPLLQVDMQLLDFVVKLLPDKSFRRMAEDVLHKRRRVPMEERFGSRYDDSELRHRSSFGRAVEHLLEEGRLQGGGDGVRLQIKLALEQELQRRPDPVDAFREPLSELQRVFRLDDQALEMLLFVFCIDQGGDFEDFLRGLNIQDTINFASRATGLSFGVVRRMLGSKGPLAQSGLIDEDSLRHSYPQVEDSIREYLSGVIDTPLAERYVRQDEGERFRIDSYCLSRDKVDLVKQLLSGDGPGNILLYGIPGTGKTEFARSVARAAGRKAFFLKLDENDRRPYNNSRVALQVALDTAEREQGVLIVDEADDIINTKVQGFFGLMLDSGNNRGEKAWLNGFLERSRVHTIWISNRVHGMEESVQRRFLYSLQFRDFTRKQRLAIWLKLTAKHPLHDRLDKQLMYRLAAEYPANAGGVAAALDGLARVADSHTPQQQLEAVLRELLDRHLALAGRKRRQGEVLLRPEYDPDAVNADKNVHQLLTSLKRFSTRLESTPSTERLRMTMLFEGVPGTGKTALARWLAGELGADLMIRRASDLLSMWVGQAEKNIRAAFEAAEAAGTILLIDEADSFLGKRENAVRSWEVTQVNEFLSAMENFRGILICCTNLLDNLDHAALRRFVWKIRFSPLEKDGRQQLFRRYFLDGAPLAPAIRNRLDNLSGLTPGDFRAVADRLAWQAEAGDPGEVVTELERELRYKQGTQGAIGFAGSNMHST